MVAADVCVAVGGQAARRRNVIRSEAYAAVNCQAVTRGSTRHIQRLTLRRHRRNCAACKGDGLRVARGNVDEIGNACALGCRVEGVEWQRAVEREGFRLFEVTDCCVTDVSVTLAARAFAYVVFAIEAFHRRYRAAGHVIIFVAGAELEFGVAFVQIRRRIEAEQHRAVCRIITVECAEVNENLVVHHANVVRDNAVGLEAHRVVRGDRQLQFLLRRAIGHFGSIFTATRDGVRYVTAGRTAGDNRPVVLPLIHVGGAAQGRPLELACRTCRQAAQFKFVLLRGK